MHVYLPHGNSTRDAEIFTNEGFRLSDISKVRISLEPEKHLVGTFDAFLRVHLNPATLPRPVPMEQFSQIMQKRAEQDAQWGGRHHDDSHSPQEWLSYIGKQLAQAQDALVVTGDVKTYRLRLEDIGALALAAMESFDRSI